ncbi:MAG: ABC transporter permease [Clostridia bacterium]|nr:ABC transporter permease [Clostridia bacterium]
MDMLKYIAKRLGMAILILLGVSVIIYSLARMMPTDFVDNQYSSALQQGTMQQEDVDRIKELYGLAMPEAYVDVKIGDNVNGSRYKGKTFTKEVKTQDRADLTTALEGVDNRLAENLITQEEWIAESFATRMEFYSGSYDADALRLYLYDDGTYRIYTVESKGVNVSGDETSASDSTSENNDQTITLDEVLTLKEEGKFTIGANEAFTLTVGGEEYASGSLAYRTATFFDQAGAVLQGYFSWLGNLLQGDLGMSFKYKKPVGDVIMQNMGTSFAIAFIATILQFAIAIPLGIKAATHQYGVVDYTVTILSMIGISFPTFFLAAIVIRVFAVELGWFEVGGLVSGSLPMDATWLTRMGDMLWHMVLPMFVLVVLSIGSLMRYTRTNMLEVLNADYIRTARAKGLSERSVVYKHAFRNTMIPLVTMMAGILPSLFGGAMITETVFSIPGIGKLAYDALIVADVPFIMGYNMFLAVMTVIGTLLSDLMYAVVDPRVKLGR